jgi:uncharacterized delta-60 repeat protein
VVAGKVTDNNDLLIARFEVDGDSDLGFGSRGFLSDPFLFGVDGSRGDVAVAPDGRIVVTTAAKGGGFALARYTIGGTLDSSFGPKSDGHTDLGLGSSSSGGTLVLQPDGKIVAAGFPLGITVMLVARLDSSGKPDLSFGTNGVAQINFSQDLQANEISTDLALDPDGNIIVAGTVIARPGNDDPGADFALARVTRDGKKLDVGFGTKGLQITDFGRGQEIVGALALAPDGRIVLAGVSGLEFALARYWS